MSYYIAGAMALREQWFHGMRHARDPFAFGPDGQTLDKRKVVRLDAAGLVIGLLPDIGYEEQTVQLHSGDLLVAYTDGITEAMNVKVRNGVRSECSVWHCAKTHQPVRRCTKSFKPPIDLQPQQLSTMT
jgi:hypothetical protein